MELFKIVKYLRNRKCLLMANFMGKSIKIFVMISLIKDTYDHCKRDLEITRPLESMLELYHVFNGRTPHLYKDGNFSDPNSFRRAESI